MFIDNLVTRFPNGVTNRDVGDIFNSLKCNDPTRYHTYFDDFDYFNAASWTVTETQAGATQALTDGDGGLLALVNSAADDDLNAIQKVGESFKFESGKKLFYRIRCKVSDATQSDVVVGLLITDTTPLDVTDGVYFIKSDGAATLTFAAEKNNVAVSAAAIATMVSDTFIELAFFYDGDSRIYYGSNGTVLGYITPAASFPDDEELTVSLAVQNGDGNARTLTIDYVFAAKER